MQLFICAKILRGKPKQGAPFVFVHVTTGEGLTLTRRQVENMR